VIIIFLVVSTTFTKLSELKTVLEETKKKMGQGTPGGVPLQTTTLTGGFFTSTWICVGGFLVGRATGTEGRTGECLRVNIVGLTWQHTKSFNFSFSKI
jgi:hypothetical protein